MTTTSRNDDAADSGHPSTKGIIMSTTIEAMTTIAVSLQASDPVSRAGIGAELGQRGDVILVDDEAAADVALLVVQEVDEAAQRQVRRLRRAGVDGVVLVVARLDDQGLFAAVEAGACGLLRRDGATARRLHAAIRDAHAGKGSLPGDLLGRLMQQVTQIQDRVLGPRGMHLNGLCDREIDVLRLVAAGHTTAEIASELSYSERTIKNVIQDVTTRLNLRNRSHAVAYAMRQGLI